MYTTIGCVYMGFFMEKPCERCKTVTICDSEHRICYDCFVELDLKEAEEE